MKPQIIYVFDGYCGWCWGMSANMGRLSEQFKNQFAFSALSGGLITGERIGPIGSFSDYIEKAIPRVAELTGASFSDAYLARIRDRNTIQDSTIPAAAFAAIVKAKPQTNSIALAHDLLSLNFTQGLDISLPESYSALFDQYGLPPAETADALREGTYAAAAEQQFARARDLGAGAFPAIVYGQGENFFPLCEGYQGYDALAHALEVLHKDPPAL